MRPVGLKSRMARGAVVASVVVARRKPDHRPPPNPVNVSSVSSFTSGKRGLLNWMFAGAREVIPNQLLMRWPAGMVAVPETSGMPGTIQSTSTLDGAASRILARAWPFARRSISMDSVNGAPGLLPRLSLPSTASPSKSPSGSVVKGTSHRVRERKMLSPLKIPEGSVVKGISVRDRELNLLSPLKTPSGSVVKGISVRDREPKLLSPLKIPAGSVVKGIPHRNREFNLLSPLKSPAGSVNL